LLLLLAQDLEQNLSWPLAISLALRQNSAPQERHDLKAPVLNDAAMLSALSQNVSVTY
jgi:hypothetical protein